MGLFSLLSDSTAKNKVAIPYPGRLDGFVDPAGVIVSYNDTARTVTLSHASGTVGYWHAGIYYALTSPVSSSAHTDSAGVYWLVIGASGAFTWQTSVWSLATQTPVAFAYYLGSGQANFCLREPHGLMDWETHLELHERLGTYRRSGLLFTAGSYAVGSDTDADVTPLTDEGVIVDEDLPTTIAARTTAGYTRVHFINSVAVFTINSTLPFPSTGGIQYNPGGTSIAAMPANNTYVNVYTLYAPTALNISDNSSYRSVWMIGQSTYTSLATAQAEDPRSLNWGDILTKIPEFCVFVKTTYHYSNSFGGTGKCKVAAEPIYISGGRSELVGVSGLAPATHNNLSGRTDVGCHPGSAIELTASGTQTYTDVAASIQHLYDKYPGFTDYKETVTGSAKSVFTLTGIDVASDHKIDVLIDGRDQTETDSWARTVGSPGQITMQENVNIGSRFKARVYTK